MAFIIAPFNPSSPPNGKGWPWPFRTKPLGFPGREILLTKYIGPFPHRAGLFRKFIPAQPVGVKGMGPQICCRAPGRGAGRPQANRRPAGTRNTNNPQVDGSFFPPFPPPDSNNAGPNGLPPARIIRSELTALESDRRSKERLKGRFKAPFPLSFPGNKGFPTATSAVK